MDSVEPDRLYQQLCLPAGRLLFPGTGRILWPAQRGNTLCQLCAAA